MKPIEHIENKAEQPIKEKQTGARTGYALSWDELGLIKAAHNILSDFLVEVLKEDPAATDPFVLVTEEKKQAAKKLIEEAGLKADRLYRIANRVLSGKWWALSNVGIYHDEGNRVKLIKALTTYDGREQALPVEEWPAFYAADTIAGKREALGIPRGCKYIDRSEIPELNLIKTLLAPVVLDTPVFLDIPTNKLTSALSLGRRAIDSRQIVGSKRGGQVMVKNEDRGLTLLYSLEAEKSINLLSAGPQDLLDQVNMKLHESNYASDIVTIPLKEYQELRGLKDVKTAREKLRRDTEALYALSVELKDDDPKGAFDKARFFERAMYKPYEGAVFRLTKSYHEWQAAHALQPMQMPKEFYKLPDKGSVRQISRKLCEHARINAGGKNANTISVKALLEISTLPPYETLSDKGRASQLIINPFIEALDKLADTGAIEWTFAYASRSRKKGALSDEDLDKVYRSYDVFSSMMIRYAFKTDPDYAGLVASKRKIKAAAKASAAKKTRNKNT